MRRDRKSFGPLFRGTLAFAGLVLVAYYLWGWGPSLREYASLRSLAAELRSPSPLVHRHAADALAKAGAPGIPWLVEAAGDWDGGVRWLAYSALGRSTPLPGPTLPTLMHGLRDPDSRIRREAADALARLGPDAVASVDALTRALTDEDPEVRFRAARALSRMGDAAGGRALGTLLALMSDPDPAHLPDRTVLVPVVRRMGPSAEARAIGALIPMTGAKDPSTRRTSIECLGPFGPRAREAVPALEVALGDEDRIARCLAALALSEIEGWEKGRARAMLREFAGDPSLPPPLRKQVAWVLSADLVAGSEVWQPVHTLRGLVDEMRLAEARRDLPKVGEVDVEEVPVGSPPTVEPR